MLRIGGCSLLLPLRMGVSLGLRVCVCGFSLGTLVALTHLMVIIIADGYR